MDHYYMYVIYYKEIVNEGDNYAGYYGYRERRHVCLNVDEYKSWMHDRVLLIQSKKVVIERIRKAAYLTPVDMDITIEIAESLETVVKKEKAREKDKLLKQKKILESRLKEMD